MRIFGGGRREPAAAPPARMPRGSRLWERKTGLPIPPIRGNGWRALWFRPRLLIGVSRDLSRNQDLNEARHRDKVYRCGNGHCQQLGRGDLPAWIPTCHHPPRTRGRGNSEPVKLSGARNRAHPAPLLVWLRSLGLGQHEAAFRQNDIDGTVLPNLTAEDLKELSVAALGHRRKLLDAIAALRADASA